MKDGVQAGLVIMDIFLLFPRFHVENVDEYLNVAKDVVPLIGQVVLQKRLLTATVPKIEHKSAQKSNMGTLYINWK